MPSEQKALRLSAILMAVMAVSGLGFAVVSHSQAIMLDGVFSTVGFLIALLTLKVAELVRRPDDDRFHFGYAHFAPLLNVAKSLLMVVMCVFASVSAVETMMSGGRELEMGWALVYGVVATVSCSAAALTMRAAARKTKSTLVEVDAVTWFVDTLISGAVMLGFLLAYLIRDTALQPYQSFVDPIIVIALVVIALPQPSRILWASLRESLLFAPPSGFQQTIREKVDKTFSGYAFDTYRVRLLKLGDTVNVMIHVKPSEQFDFSGISALDQIRNQVKAELDTLSERIILDIVFVDDMALSD